MSYFKPLLSAGAAALLASTAGAQTYDTNYLPLHASGSASIAGPVAFSGGFLFGHNAGFGDSIRRCYSHDVTQGGRNQSKRSYETTRFTLMQGWAPLNPVPGVSVGIVSVQGATESVLGRDVCISPWGASPGNTGGHNVGGAANIGTIGGTGTAGFPSFWEIAFQWVASSVGNINWIGVEGNHATLHPLLVNMIYEVQGPTNDLNVQYYLGTTIEKAGTNPTGPGGVAKGNAAMGSVVYGGLDPVASNAISHTRLTSNGPSGLLVGPLAPFGGAGKAELWSRVAFMTPVLWSVMDGHDGAGAPDWHVGSAPVAVVDIRMTDNLAGAEWNNDIYWKSVPPSVPPGIATTVYNPTLFFNQGYLLWSAKKSTGQQKPTSWDDLGFAAIPAVKGSILLGPVATSREGFQTVPANFDNLMQALIPITALSLLGGFSFAEDPNLDGVVPDSTGNSHSIMWEGGFDPMISGLAGLSGGALPIVGAPSVSLVGAKIGIAAIGIQLDATIGFFTYPTEIANSMEVVFQP